MHHSLLCLAGGGGGPGSYDVRVYGASRAYFSPARCIADYNALCEGVGCNKGGHALCSGQQLQVLEEASPLGQRRVAAALVLWRVECCVWRIVHGLQRATHAGTFESATDG